MTTWTSLRRPFLKVGRSGRSIRRQVRIASSPGPALGPEERAGDLARGVHPLLDVDRQGEEVEVVLRVLAGGGRRQQHRVVVEVGGHRTGGLAGKQPGLELDGAGAELAVVDNGLDGGDDGFSQGLTLSVRGAIRASTPALCSMAGLRSRHAGRCVLGALSATTEDRDRIDAGRSCGLVFSCAGSDPRSGPAAMSEGTHRSGGSLHVRLSGGGRGAPRSSGSARSRSSSGS